MSFHSSNLNPLENNPNKQIAQHPNNSLPSSSPSSLLTSIANITRHMEDDHTSINSSLQEQNSVDQEENHQNQLLLLQELWARSGTNQDVLFHVLQLLQATNILNIKRISPELHSALQYSNDSQLLVSSSPTVSVPKNTNNWYNIVEKTIQQTPNTKIAPESSTFTDLISSLSTNQPILEIQPVHRKLVSILKQSRFATDFEPISFVGRGGFGSVLKAESKSDKLCYAIKIVHFRDFAVPSKSFQRVFREVSTLARLDHVNIVRYYSAWIELTEEYKDMLKLLEQPPNSEFEHFRCGGANTSFLSTSEDCKSNIFNIDDYIEDDMSAMSVCVPYESSEDKTQSYDESECSVAVKDDESYNIFAGGSVEIGFHGDRASKKENKKSILNRSSWRAESSSHVPRVRHMFKKCFETTKKERILSQAFQRVPTKILSVAESSTASIHAKQFDYTLFIQTQLYEHETLKHWLTKENREINKKENLRIFLQIVLGLEHVHQNDLLHRDLKPANIFISKEGIIKIGDFGLARDLDYLPEQGSEFNIKMKRNPMIPFDGREFVCSNQTFSVGTPGYVAPEVLNCEPYGPKVDIYSLGIILMEMFTKPKTKHEKGINLMKLKERRIPEEIEKNFPDVADLIIAMTEPEAEERISLSEILSIVEFALDDYKHLRRQLKVRDKKIQEQQEQIDLLIRENNALRCRMKCK